MNRVKKELIRKGIKLEHQYMYIPYELKGKPFQPGYISLLGVYVNSEKATVIRDLNIGVEVYTLQRNGNTKMEFK